jgi:hypothetical protein
MIRLFSGRLIIGVFESTLSLLAFVCPRFVLIPVAVLEVAFVSVVVCVNRSDDDVDIVDLDEDIPLQFTTENTEPFDKICFSQPSK